MLKCTNLSGYDFQVIELEENTGPEKHTKLNWTDCVVSRTLDFFVLFNISMFLLFLQPCTENRTNALEKDKPAHAAVDEPKPIWTIISICCLLAIYYLMPTPKWVVWTFSDEHFLTNGTLIKQFRTCVYIDSLPPTKRSNEIEYDISKKVKENVNLKEVITNCGYSQWTKGHELIFLIDILKERFEIGLGNYNIEKKCVIEQCEKTYRTEAIYFTNYDKFIDLKHIHKQAPSVTEIKASNQKTSNLANSKHNTIVNNTPITKNGDRTNPTSHQQNVSSEHKIEKSAGSTKERHTNSNSPDKADTCHTDKKCTYNTSIIREEISCTDLRPAITEEESSRYRNASKTDSNHDDAHVDSKMSTTLIATVHEGNIMPKETDFKELQPSRMPERINLSIKECEPSDQHIQKTVAETSCIDGNLQSATTDLEKELEELCQLTDVSYQTTDMKLCETDENLQNVSEPDGSVSGDPSGSTEGIDSVHSSLDEVARIKTSIHNIKQGWIATQTGRTLTSSLIRPSDIQHIVNSHSTASAQGNWTGMRLKRKPFEAQKLRSCLTPHLKDMRAILPLKARPNVTVFTMDRFSLNMSTRQPPSNVQGISWDNFERETMRIASFTMYPTSAAKSPRLLAAAGFVYIGNGSNDKVICFYCYVEKENWNVQDNIEEVHRLLSPNCPMVAVMATNNAVATTVTVNIAQNQPQSNSEGRLPVAASTADSATSPSTAPAAAMEATFLPPSSSPTTTAAETRDIDEVDGPRNSQPPMSRTQRRRLQRQRRQQSQSPGAASPLPTPARQDTSSSSSHAIETQAQPDSSNQTHSTNPQEQQRTAMVPQHRPNDPNTQQQPYQTARVFVQNFSANDQDHQHPNVSSSIIQTQQHPPRTTAALQDRQQTDIPHQNSSGISPQDQAHVQQRRDLPITSIPSPSTNSYDRPDGPSPNPEHRPNESSSTTDPQNLHPNINSQIYAIPPVPRPPSEVEEQEFRTVSPSAANNFGSVPPELNYESLGIFYGRAKIPEYAVCVNRSQTYESWPRSHPIKPEDLIKSGLYYAGYGDSCKCFFCGGGLRSWEKDDDPLVEHARWFPKCGYIRQYMGNNFVHAVQELSLRGGTITLQQVQRFMQEKGLIREFTDAPIEEDAAVRSVLAEGYAKETVCRAAQTLLDEGESLSADAILAKLKNEVHETNGATGVASNSKQNRSTETENREDIEELKDRNATLRNNLICKICMDKQVRMVFLPCGHLVACQECAVALQDCPVCRKHIRATVRANTIGMRDV